MERPDTWTETVRHKRITLALAALGVLLLAVSGPGVRAGLWSFRVGFGMFAGALLVGFAAAGAAIIALALPHLRAHSVPAFVAALVLGAATAAVPLEYIHLVMTLPYINDITTDSERPPPFSPPKTYESYFGELQRRGYPELHPLELARPPQQAFARAVEIARDEGWEITALDEAAGRIQAVATTRWFGFHDDVAIRIEAAGAGSRIDLRSKSRSGRSDFGTNARRIREFLARMDK
jgi:uncharacterized protein (DUF1499 family)